MKRLWAFAAVAAIVLGGCSSSIATPNQVPVTRPSPPPPSSKIQHVVILLQENRSFNNIFMGFPGADTSTTGKCREYTNKKYNETFCKGGQVVTLHHIRLQSSGNPGFGTDIQHDHKAFVQEYNGGAMDGFDTLTYGTTGGPGLPAGKYPYAYVKRSEVGPYWDMASRYALGDHMFSTGTTDSFVAHQEIVAGTVRLNSNESLTDTPSSLPWGCDSSPGTKTTIILTSGRVLLNRGPFPCFTQYKTMADVLDAAGVTWRYYVQSLDSSSPYFDISGEAWNGFDPIKAVRNGTEWKNISIPNKNVFKDIKAGTLPQVSWVIPYVADSDHPASGNEHRAVVGSRWLTPSVIVNTGTTRHCHPVGRLGRVLRSGAAAAARLYEPWFSRTDDRRFALRQTPLRIEDAIRVRKRTEVHRAELWHGVARRYRRPSEFDRRYL